MGKKDQDLKLTQYNCFPKLNKNVLLLTEREEFANRRVVFEDVTFRGEKTFRAISSGHRILESNHTFSVVV